MLTLGFGPSLYSCVDSSIVPSPTSVSCFFCISSLHIMANTSSQTHMPGRQLLPVVVDERNPNWLFARVPRSPTNLQDGFLNVTCGDFARAVNRAAGWLEDIFGQSLTFDTLAYLGPSDIRYTIFVLGASKVGFKVNNF